MNKLTLTVILSLLFVFVHAQDEDQAIQKGKIIISDSTIIDAQFIVIGQDSVKYYENDSKVRKVAALNQVMEIQKYDGNYGNTGMWIGGFAGIGIGVAIALGTKETDRTSMGYGYIEETTIQTWPIYVMTALGTLLGYVIGSTAEDWETVYSNNSSFYKNIDMRVDNNMRGFILSYRIKL
jgi:prolyl-tRNA synthetase